MNTDIQPVHVDPKSISQPISTPWWQRSKSKIALALLGLVMVLGLINVSIQQYEQHLATGDTVLLELAPVDPRGMMQGDYMALQYQIEPEVFNALQHDPNSFPTSEGFVVLAKDSHNVGHFVRVETHGQTAPLSANEIRLHYRLRHGTFKLATNAFFFQEGHSEAFENAEYGLFRVNEKGEPLLTDLVNEQFEVIEPKVKNQ